MYTHSGQIWVSIIYNKPSIKCLQDFLQMGKVSVFSQIEKGVRALKYLLMELTYRAQKLNKGNEMVLVSNQFKSFFDMVLGYFLTYFFVLAYHWTDLETYICNIFFF